jgi:hypothetical protein
VGGARPNGQRRTSSGVLADAPSKGIIEDEAQGADRSMSMVRDDLDGGTPPPTEPTERSCSDRASDDLAAFEGTGAGAWRRRAVTTLDDE